MNDTLDWLSILLCTAFSVFWVYRDVQSSKEMTPLGIGEEQFWASSKGKFVEWKGWAVRGLFFALGWIAFLFGTQSDPSTYNQYWDRFYCGPIVLVGGIASMFAYFHNKKKIAYRKEHPRTRTGEIYYND